MVIIYTTIIGIMCCWSLAKVIQAHNKLKKIEKMQEKLLYNIDTTASAGANLAETVMLLSKEFANFREDVTSFILVTTDFINYVEQLQQKKTAQNLSVKKGKKENLN